MSRFARAGDLRASVSATNFEQGDDAIGTTQQKALRDELPNGRIVAGMRIGIVRDVRHANASSSQKIYERPGERKVHREDGERGRGCCNLIGVTTEVTDDRGKLAHEGKPSRNIDQPDRQPCLPERIQFGIAGPQGQHDIGRADLVGEPQREPLSDKRASAARTPVDEHDASRVARLGLSMFGLAGHSRMTGRSIEVIGGGASRLRHEITDFPHGAFAAFARGHIPGQLVDVLMRVIDDDRQPDVLEAGPIIDVVADIADLFERYTEPCRHVPERAKFGLDALQAVDLEFLCACGHDRIDFGRDDERCHAGPFKPPQADAVEAAAADRFPSVLKDVDCIVGKYAVEIEHHQPQGANPFGKFRVVALHRHPPRSAGLAPVAYGRCYRPTPISARGRRTLGA